MNYLEFRNSFIDVGCFGVNQILASYPNFNKNNLTRWVEQGMLVKLRQGFYAFQELSRQNEFALYISNRIYKPSYVSLHTALAFYGIIPEAVTQITAVSTLKTAEFKSSLGTYSYNKIKEECMFGYELKPFKERTIQFAYPENALLDLLYLFPFYNTAMEMEGLRLDEDFLENHLNWKRFDEFSERLKNKALNKRVELLKKTYGI